MRESAQSGDELSDLWAFVQVARAGGYRSAARATDGNASRLGDAIRRLEARLGVRLLQRTTRSVSLTPAGARLLAQVEPALGAVSVALDGVNAFRDRPAGRLRINVPTAIARLVLPAIVPPFLAKYPEIELEVVADERRIDIVKDGFDAGVRYGQTLEQDMHAVPIGPRVQRYAACAAPAYIAQRGRPTHPEQLLEHACIRWTLADGASVPWQFERDGQAIEVQPSGPLIAGFGGATDLAIDAAIAGVGVIYLFESWLRPAIDRGALVPLLEPWSKQIEGPFLYYPGRRYVPAPLRAFIEFVKAHDAAKPRRARASR